jgi:hypothetical protein
MQVSDKASIMRSLGLQSVKVAPSGIFTSSVKSFSTFSKTVLIGKVGACRDMWGEDGNGTRLIN